MNKDFFQWYLSSISKVVFLFITFYLFLKRTWVGEDAFIFFRYVDNLVYGNGLVFNLGERVEGFTAPLWVFTLALLRKVTEFELRPTAIILGLVLSTLSIALLIYFEHQREIFFPLVVTLMITNSAFRDFATSGFETSLTYLLLISALICIKRELHFSRPEIVGILLSLLVLNRPESALILFYVSVLIILKKDLKIIIRFFIPVILFVGGYQIFRMGYFASLLPNTFYAKKGGVLYISQGFNYLKDFVLSYPLTFVIYLGLTCYTLVNKKLRDANKHILIISALLMGYVLYAGGDYMHGRSLLLAFIVLSVGLIDAGSYILLSQFVLIILVMLIGYLGIKQIPITKKVYAQINNINDERSHFGYSFKSDEFKEYLSLPITGEFGWAERGFYYRELYEQLKVPFSVVNGNIGYFGYAVGENINVMSSILVDPYLARLDTAKRGKIGHENDLPWEYILSRKPTFSYTPFKYWNVNAHFKWESAAHASIIKDDSDDSFVPIFDLSNKEFLDKYSVLIGKNIKNDIDTAQRNFLLSLTKDTADYLGFLKVYWYPYADAEDQKLFDLQSNTIEWVAGESVYERFEATQIAKVDEIWSKAKNPMSFDQFVLNISYSVKNK